MRPGHPAGAFAFPPSHDHKQPIDEHPNTAELIRSRHDAVLPRLRQAAVAVARDPEEESVVAVTKAFGSVKALDGVGLTLRPCEIHALMGENGACKSTLIKVLTGV